MTGPALALRQVAYENRAFWRNPPAAFFTFVFPLLFMVIFNVIFGEGVAQFFKYLASTENQAWWATVTGYLPLTQAAVKAMEASGVYAKNPHLKTAVAQMNAGKTTPNSQGLRLGNYGSIRDAIEEQMENVFAGKKTAKQGLDDAVAKSNDILKEFAALYK